MSKKRKYNPNNHGYQYPDPTLPSTVEGLRKRWQRLDKINHEIQAQAVWEIEKEVYDHYEKQGLGHQCISYTKEPRPYKKEDIETLKWRGYYNKETLTVKIQQALRSIEMKLGHAFPSSPTRTPVYHFFFIDKERGKRISYSFCAEYSAQKFINLVIRDLSYKWISDNRLKLSSGITIKGHGLREVMDHKMSKLEKTWQLPHPVPNVVKRFLGEEAKLMIVPKATKPTSEAPLPKKVKKKRVSREGLITIAQLAEEVNMIPREARMVLRKAKVKKPDAGWAWPEDSLEKIRKLLR